MYCNSSKHVLIDKIKQILIKNTLSGYSKWKHSNYRFIAPSNVEYTFQWLWDTAFHAIVLSNFDTDWAKREIHTLMMGQWEDGFVPHTIFWGDRKILPHWAYIESRQSLRPQTTAHTQPPMVALAVESIYEKDPDLEFLKEVLPKIAKFHRWLIENRDDDQDELVSIISPNESGMDELPVFQLVAGFPGQNTARLHYYFRKPDLLNYRFNYDSKKILKNDHFNCEEVLFNTILVEANRALARLFTAIGNREESYFFELVANKEESALLTKCWDKEDDIFYSLYSHQEKFAKVKTIASLMPIFLDGIDKKKLNLLVSKHLLNPQEFWTPFPLPSVARNEPYYEPGDPPAYKVKLLWRGPTWINTNWFIVKGLRKHGLNSIADNIVHRMCKMVDEWGFREYYNPETGEGYRREDFGWSTLLLDLL